MKHVKDKYSKCSHCGGQYDFVIIDSSIHGLVIQCSCGSTTKVKDLLKDYQSTGESVCHWCFRGYCFHIDCEGIACSGINVFTCNEFKPE